MLDIGSASGKSNQQDASKKQVGIMSQSSRIQSGGNAVIEDKTKMHVGSNNFGQHLRRTEEPEFMQKEESSNFLFIVSVILLILSVSFAIYLYFAQESFDEVIKTKEAKQEDISEEINSNDFAEVKEFSDRYVNGFDTFSRFLMTHKSAKKLLEELEKVVVDDARLQSFSLNEENEVQMSISVSDLDAVSRQTKSFETSNLFLSLEFTGARSSSEDDQTYYISSYNATLDKDMYLLGNDDEELE